MNESQTSVVIEGVGRLAEEASSAQMPEALELSAHCERALRALREGPDSFERPFHVALVGPSGGGKSSLFNTLIGKPDASAVSDGRAGCTRRPCVAHAAGDKPLINRLDELAPPPVYISCDLPVGTVIIDTPSVNCDDPDYLRQTQDVIARSDLVVLVMFPEGRADHDVIDQLRALRRNHRWLFVVNKIDKAAENDLGPIREDFDHRLRQLGFEPNDQVRFLVCGRDENRFDFARLRDQIFGDRPREAVRLSRLNAALGYAQEAVVGASTQTLTAATDRLDAQLAELNDRVRRVYREALGDADIQRQLNRMVAAQSWIAAADNLAWPMSMAVQIRNRLALLMVGYHLSRLMTGSVSVWRLLQLAGSSVAAAAQGVLPAMRVSARIGDRCQDELSRVALDAAEILVEHGVSRDAAHVPGRHEVDLPSAADTDEPPPPEKRHDRTWADRLGGAVVDSAIERAAGWVNPRVPSETAAENLVEPLQVSIRRSAEDLAQARVGLGLNVLVNLLPVAALVSVLWRLGVAWWTADYLPWEFYPMAFTVFFGSFLPGLVMLTIRLRPKASTPIPDAIENLCDHPATRPLAQHVDRCRNLLRGADRLHQQIIAWRRASADTISDRFGQSVVDENDR